MTAPYSPRLPILVELEQQLHEQLDEAYGPLAVSQSTAVETTPASLTREPPAAATTSPARRHDLSPSGGRDPRPLRTGSRRRARGRVRRRIVTRVGTLAAIVGVIGGVAVADQESRHSPALPTSSPAQIGAGSAAAGAWQLSAYRHTGALCQLFTVAGTESSVCGAVLGATQLRATSALDDERRFVTGLAGSGVVSVRVRVGTSTETIATTAVTGSQLQSGSLPAGLRWFVASFPRDEVTSEQPAFVQALDAHGYRAGKSYLDCTIGQGTVPCLRLAEQESR